MRLCRLVVALFLTSAISSGVTIVNFAVVGDTILPSFSQSGMTVTGSADLHFFTLFGGAFGNLGVVGGSSDSVADNGEYLDFVFGNPVTDLGYSVMLSGCHSNCGADPFSGGYRKVTVFGGAGSLLGEYVDQGNSVLFSVSSQFPQLITRIRLTALPDNDFTVGLVQFTPVPESGTSPTPEPSTLALAAVALGVGAWTRGQRTQGRC